ncbi:epsin-1 isoform X2 [Monodelphis domestica]|uniref:epsin-1 isoform X2 n=1 Tax=Monodelphis domestica TaxID=13616 RepID=UPI0024E1E78D|nr:epsin-1 isoform X2 [Monodelphis domestica]XP_056652515.1 epsin-1 isoform X2 [Monodelphis domestica]
MSTSSLRRQMKNIVHNYSEAEIKVREATSNDPWGPSSSLMSEIADLTYNVVAFSEIMSMIWKRLNDHGKNWRHVYKAMTLMEYLIKTGSERVSQQCKENMYAVQTLKDFQYVDRDGKDQGINVREKAKQLVALLRDEDRLREERAHALKTKEKLAQTATASSAAVGSGAPPEAEQAWPQSSGEEELQLQLALAMSKEEADQEERIRRGDDLRLQMAIEESKRETGGKEESSLMDLADVFTAPAPPSSDPWGGPGPTTGPPSDPWGGPPGPPVPPAADPWGGPAPTPASGDPWRPAPAPGPAADPWGGPPAPPAGEGGTSDPWGASDGPGGAPGGGPSTADPWAPTPAFSDPWGGSPAKPSTNGTPAPGGFDAEPDEFSDFDRLRTALPVSGSSTGELELLAGEVPARSPGAFDLSGVGGSLAEAVGSPPPTVPPAPTPPTRKTPESFLGPNAALVDLDSLVTRPGPAPPGPKASNPFLPTGAPGTATGPSLTNPFQPPPPATLTLNQLRLSPVPPAPGAPAAFISPLGGGPGLPPMMPPGSQPPNTNPFLL